ncbi:regulator of chromosome condensation/beta-lactamase-inhibitor protein II [Naviculisporaceae sp. PSN 640]
MPRGRPPKAQASKPTVAEKTEPTTKGRPGRKRKSDLPIASAGPKKSRVDEEVVPRLRALRIQNSTLGAQIGDPGSPRPRGRPPKGQERVTFTPNHPPSDGLAVFVFGDGDMGALGLGPKGKEATRPRLNPFLDPSKPTGYEVVQLACGGLHVIALTKDNRILTWGVNDNSALGRDTTWDGEKLRDMDDDASSDDDEDDLNPLESTPTPIPASSFPPGTRFTQVAAADNLSLALTDTGIVYAWGTFLNHEGHKSFSQRVEKQTSPVQVPNLSSITSITCGSNHCLALSSTGSLFAWGIPDENRLGRRISPRHYYEAFTPHLVEIKSVTAIFSGNRHSFAVDARDNVWSWGLNSYGQAGSNPEGAGSPGGVYLDRPRKILPLCGKGVKVIAGGTNHSAAITRNGECYLWGRMDGGQLGIDFTEAQLADPDLIKRGELRNEPRICLQPTLIKVPGLERVASVACGIDHTIFVTEDGKAFSTGFGSGGQLGLGPEDDEVDVARQINAKSVREVRLVSAAAGGNFSVLCSVYTTGARRESAGAGAGPGSST